MTINSNRAGMMERYWNSWLDFIAVPEPETVEIAGISSAPAWLIAQAMAIGAVLGALEQTVDPVIQRAMDGALVLAGIVHEPPGSVMEQYYLGSWTALHQIPAVLLRFGLSFSIVNELLTLIGPMFLCGAFSMIVYGLTGRPRFCVLAGTACFLTGLLSIYFSSPDYGLLGAKWNNPGGETFGVVGGILAAWCIGCVAGGRYGLAAFSSVALLAIHPVLGAYSIALLFCALISARYLWVMRIPRSVFYGIVAGVVIVAASLAGYLAVRPPVGWTTAANDASYYEAYLRYWDHHRNRPTDLFHTFRVVFVVIVLGGATCWLAFADRGRREPIHVAALAILIGTCGSAALYFLFHYAREFLPQMVISAIPGRFLSVQAYLVPGLLVGLLAKFLVSLPQNVVGTHETDRTLSLIGLTWRKAQGLLPNRPEARIAVLGFALVLVTAPSLAEVAVAVSGVFVGRSAGFDLPEDKDTFWKNLQHRENRKAVLASTDVAANALRFGHLPVVLDAASFDFIPYMPGTSQTVGRIVQEGYGVSFFSPPQSMRYRGGLAPETGKQYWACLSGAQWRAIGQSIGVDAVIAPRSWQARLPVEAASKDYVMYQIPGAETRLRASTVIWAQRCSSRGPNAKSSGYIEAKQ